LKGCFRKCNSGWPVKLRKKKPRKTSKIDTKENLKPLRQQKQIIKKKKKLKEEVWGNKNKNVNHRVGGVKR